jgi:hypothetical protein
VPPPSRARRTAAWAAARAASAGSTPALEALRRLRQEAGAPRGPADRPGLEAGALEEDPGGRRRHLGGLAAHHSSQGDRPRGVGDDQIALDQPAVLAVEGGQALAGPGPSDPDDRGRRQAVPVEGVERLPQLEQHVVGDVDQVRDRPDADRAQALREAARRRPDGDAVDDPGDVARAADRIVDRQRD